MSASAPFFPSTPAAPADLTPEALVVGGGLAGVTAALSLKQRGVEVVVSRAGFGHTATFSGIWRLGVSRAVLASRPDATLAEHVRDIALHQPSHPFARLGPTTAHAALERGYGVIRSATQDALSLPAPQMPQSASLCPVSRGVLEAGGVGPMMASWPSSAPPQAILVLDLMHFGAPLDARATLGWQHDARSYGLADVRFDVVQPPAPSTLPASARLHAAGLARYLNEADGLAVFAEAIRAHLPENAQEVWLPSIVGLRAHVLRMTELTERLGRRCREVAAADGVVMGLRRQYALEDALTKAHIPVLPKTQRLELTPTHVRATLADGRLVSAASLALASGRFVGGGLMWKSQQRCVESMFGWPLMAFDVPVHERSPLELTSPLARSPQAIEAAGVASDAHCRVEVSTEQCERVSVAGGLQGGWHERHTPSADGVALATGARAAESLTDLLSGGAIRQGA